VIAAAAQDEGLSMLSGNRLALIGAPYQHRPTCDTQRIVDAIMRGARARSEAGRFR